jgi:glycosyltransferase involved in cell wall biosynthesis
MAKVLWLSDAGCTTGFGRVTHSIGERLVRDFGHEIHVLAVNYRGDSYPGLLDPTKPTPLRLYMPTQLDPKDRHGMTRIVELLANVEPDVVVSLNDPQTLITMLFHNRMDPTRVLLAGAPERDFRARPIIAYTPCDGIGLPSQWLLLAVHTNLVAMSKWGQDQYPNSQLVYHGVDTDQFWPVTRERPIHTSTGLTIRSKTEAKQAFGYEASDFVIGRVDANSQRKDYASSWKALVPFLKRHSDARVYWHADRRPGQSLGVDMDNMFSREEDLAGRFKTPDQRSTFIGWPQQDMNALYNAFDVFMSTSWGEGFGLTLAEAAACAIPIVAQNVSAIPEVVGPGGILVEPKTQVTVPSGEDQWLPDPVAFTAALEKLYMGRGMRRDLGRLGRDHVVKTFSWDAAAADFHQYIEALAQMR